VFQFVCECDVVKDTGKEEYLRPFIHIGLDCVKVINVNNDIRNLACIGLVAYRNNDLFTLINMIEVFVRCLII